ncbi:S9 family peptidase [Planobacterium oryzisoli]|uniref:S9 family peptidase n=1 Tax=Planobacterium oryzisoli TaxID=2771435 RepID=A0A930YW99_9FLAO|nr:S9 family peptidase [Planobacterium oryzisoli]MBF5027587.1 S9 family peptidase [Planobacterium oryzisoli]
MNLKHSLMAIGFIAPLLIGAQQVLTPELMWSMNRLGVQAVAPDHSALIYKVSKTDLKTEKSSSENFLLNLSTSAAKQIDLGKKSLVQWDKNGLYALEEGTLYISKDLGKTWSSFYALGKVDNIRISPDQKFIAFSKEVKLEETLAKEKYSDTPNSTGYIYNDLNHRHWDTFSEGRYHHVFVVPVGAEVSSAKDLLEGKLWDSPQRPFGGAEDFIWSPDSKSLLYVVKPKSGKEYATSTNTDIFAYEIGTATTRNLTEGMMGYDMNPKFSPDGKMLLWQSMKREGYEADKNDIVVMDWKTGVKKNLTEGWDESVTGSTFWDKDSKRIFFTAAFRATKQLFSLDAKTGKISQITSGKFDVNDIYAQPGERLLVSRTDMNHSADLYVVNTKGGAMGQVTDINKALYASITPASTELKMVPTTDGKEMGVWMVYPPNFDPNKKYPTLLYAQGGPQSALTQTFSTRWNLGLMAAQGYIVIAPNRRGMPGWGTKWNEDISKDWGGQVMQDYLSAVDYAKKLPGVDPERIGAVGASYGGYSVLMLAGIHENRFKTFFSHNGLFDMNSWYHTTEELWFANWDIGSPYENPKPKAFTEFNPANYVHKWNTPLMVVQGGKDYRVPYEQGQAAFQAAQLKGLKSRLLYFPNENHWVLNPHNALVWQREFFGWLKETL